MKQNRLFAAAAALFLATAPLQAHAYSALYVFGDSLSDVGNVFIGTLGAEPAAPYVNGQFSNGPIWVQGLSQSLGLGSVAPALGGGTDYAFGGATTGYAPTAGTAPVPSLTAQVTEFLSTTTLPLSTSALYAVWIGSNDIFNIVGAAPSPIVALQDAQGAAQTEANAIAALAAAGATNFLVPLVGDLGKTPTLISLGATAIQAGSFLAASYNAALEADLAGLQATPGISLSYLDTYSLLDAAIADPGAFGLTDVTDPCYVGPYTGGGTVCGSPSQYLYWDSLHPTAAGQAIIATAAFDVVPEPATWPLLATGLLGLTLGRRRLKRLRL